MSKFLKSIIANKLIVALFSIVLGVLLLIMQGGVLATIVKMAALLCIIAGAVGIVFFLIKKNRSTTSLACSVIVLAIGILFFVRPDIIVNIFPIILGVYLVVEGLTNVLAALQHKKSNSFLVGLILGVLTLLVGLFLIFRAGTVMNIVAIVAGISLIVNGLTDLFTLRAFK
jgi:uncharacterized membrane protein HdeD (DUF308 family)